MKLTPEQENIAAAVRDELLLMFQDANNLTRRALALEGVCHHYALPALDGGLMPKLGPAVLACEAAHAAYEEFCAVSVNTREDGTSARLGEPERVSQHSGGQGRASPSADPLKAAA